MLEAAELCDELIAFFQPKLLAGKRVLITAGPTFEAIDPVRGITNLSSGKMGFAIARAAPEAGARVTLVAGPVHLPTPRGVTRIDVRSAPQMHDAVLPLAARTTSSSPPRRWPTGGPPMRRTEDQEGRQRPSCRRIADDREPRHPGRAWRGCRQRPYCVGFAAESHDLAQHAREKRVRKGVPLIVGNLGPATFGRDDNTLLLVDEQGERELPRADKLHAGARAGGRDRRAAAGATHA